MGLSFCVKYGIIKRMDEKFEYTDTDNGIMITGIDRNAGVIEIPDNIDENQVTGIGRYAFSERLELTDVILPRSVVDIGAHSFYNCKNLEHVELHDGIRELEDGAFKNCYNLRYITMYCHQGREGCIRNLMSDNIQELQLDIIYDNGERSRLIFPTFEDDYVENTPARIFQAVSYGTGGAYRQCMQVGTLDYRDFDKLFERSVREDRFEAALYNSIGRLMYPYRLYASAKDRYKDFLRDNAKNAARILIDDDNADALKYMCDNALFDEASAGAASEYAAECSNPRAAGIITAYINTHFTRMRKHFEL